MAKIREKFKKKKFFKFITWLFGLAIFFLVAKMVLDNWQALKQYQFQVNYFYLLPALFFATLNVFALAFIWRKIFLKLSPHSQLNYANSLGIFIYAWFGKYAPGRVWSALGKVYFGSQQGLSKRALGVSSVLELALFAIAQFILSLFFLIFVFSHFFLDGVYLLSGAILGAVLAGFILLHPKIFTFLLNILFKILKKETLSEQALLGYKDNLLIIFYYFLPVLSLGLSFLFLAHSFIGLARADYILMGASFVVASGVSMISFFVPAGIGVREGALVILLGLFLPLPVASLLAVVSRLWFLATDLVALLVYWVVDKWQGFSAQAIGKVSDRQKSQAKH